MVMVVVMEDTYHSQLQSLVLVEDEEPLLQKQVSKLQQSTW